MVIAKPMPLAAPVTITALFFEAIYDSSHADFIAEVPRPPAGHRPEIFGIMTCISLQEQPYLLASSR
jgi:hypothetical protein